MMIVDDPCFVYKSTNRYLLKERFKKSQLCSAENSFKSFLATACTVYKICKHTGKLGLNEHNFFVIIILDS